MLANLPLNISWEERDSRLLKHLETLQTEVRNLDPKKHRHSIEIVNKEMLMFLPISFGIGTIQLHEELIESNLLSYENVKVAALDFGIKHILFDELLMKDLKLIVLGIASVSILIWIDTKSFVFTLITVMIVILSLVFAYYCYTTVFNLHFFPFMNLLAVIVSIGIGVDDAFVYHQVWSVYRKTQQNETHRQLLMRTFKHTFVLLFSTSLTTSVAFYSLYFNNITAIKCFSIFAGTTVLFNFVLVVLLLPLILKISYRFNFPICTFKNKLFGSRTAFNLSPKSSLAVAIVFVWFTIISCFIIFVHPKLQLANSFDFQLFGSDDYFEKYDRLYRKKIPFMRAVMERTSQLPLIFVWGIVPQDNGDPLNPSQTGDLLFDPDFDLSSKEAQLWMYDFCEELKSQPFYDSNFFGPQLKNCILITLTNWMENRKCTDPITNEDRSPCCEVQQFPYEKSVFDACLKKMTNDLYDTPKDFFVPNSIAGPKYFKSNHSLGSLIIEYNSNHLFSFAYQEMTHFYETVEQWFSQKLATAPKSLAKAWFFSDFEFYDLQSLLMNGTFVSISLSMVISFFLLLALTCNFFISLFAIVCITCSILFSIAILIMLGWKLNIFESIAISTAIGLSTDFSLHYSFNFCYFLRKCRKKEKALRKTLKHIIRPTIMSGLTTAAIGLFMIPSNIIIYKQIGFFLILVMFSSWIFATFFFVSLIVLFYPKDTNSDKIDDCRTFEMNDLYY